MAFFYYTGAVQHPEKTSQSTNLPREFYKLQKILEEHAGVGAAVIQSTPPAKGLYLTVYEQTEDSSSVSMAFCRLSYLTLMVLPCYQERNAVIHFNVYRDTELQKSYRYPLKGWVAFWIGFIPLSMVNIAMTQYEQAFEAVVYQFVDEARREGVFRAPS